MRPVRHSIAKKYNVFHKFSSPVPLLLMPACRSLRPQRWQESCLQQRFDFS